jgi:hypothetical protein
VVQRGGLTLALNNATQERDRLRFTLTSVEQERDTLATEKASLVLEQQAWVVERKGLMQDQKERDELKQQAAIKTTTTTAIPKSDISRTPTAETVPSSSGGGGVEEVACDCGGVGVGVEEVTTTTWNPKKCLNICNRPILFTQSCPNALAAPPPPRPPPYQKPPSPVASVIVNTMPKTTIESALCLVATSTANGA